MKKLILVYVFLTTGYLNQLFSQVTFSVSPGFNINNATFGKKFKKAEPFAGLNVITAFTGYTETGQRYDYDQGKIVNYEEKRNFSCVALMPVIGTKYYLKEGEKLKSYITLLYSRAFIWAKVKDTEDPDLQDELNDILKKIRISGGQAGFGAEYFFDECFSLSGEFGIRFFSGKHEEEYDRTIYDVSSGQYVDTKINYKYHLGLSPTYTKIALNFYFVKQEK